MNELIERYRKLYSGVIYDALVFDLHYRPASVVMPGLVSRLAGPREPLIGPAFTCRGRRVRAGDDVGKLESIRLDIFSQLPSGSVMVIDTEGDEGVAHFGDVSALIAHTAGVAGIVIDGYTRDIDAIDEAGVPLFARGARPVDAYGRWALVEKGKALTLSEAGVSIFPDDLVFADGDGVLIIPHDRVADVLDPAERRAANEDAIRAAIRAGEPIKDIYRRLGRW